MANESVGGFIHRARTGRGMSQAELAAASGVKRDYIASIERGRISVVYPETFAALKSALGFPGWACLEAMGYETDVEDGPIAADLLVALSRLDAEAQQTLARFILSLNLRKEFPDA